MIRQMHIRRVRCHWRFALRPAARKTATMETTYLLLSKSFPIHLASL